MSCADTRTEYVPAPVVPLPPQLTADCPLPVIPDELTYGGAILLLADAMKSIADCNHDKRAIREIEAERAK
ncbi:Rz1-like lysis system protein LysC [Morganella morganii]